MPSTRIARLMWLVGIAAPALRQTTSTDYKTDCLTCHVPAKQTDWIYTQGYPPLQKP